MVGFVLFHYTQKAVVVGAIFAVLPEDVHVKLEDCAHDREDGQ
jgi:hypothetical protein